MLAALEKCTTSWLVNTLSFGLIQGKEFLPPPTPLGGGATAAPVSFFLTHLPSFSLFVQVFFSCFIESFTLAGAV
jgi:hypothetical protein